jgi:hypothetical protein
MLQVSNCLHHWPRQRRVAGVHPEHCNLLAPVEPFGTFCIMLLLISIRPQPPRKGLVICSPLPCPAHPHLRLSVPGRRWRPLKAEALDRSELACRQGGRQEQLNGGRAAVALNEAGVQQSLVHPASGGDGLGQVHRVTSNPSLCCFSTGHGVSTTQV